MKIGIAGLGLIGGSLALALRSAHEVRGYDIEPRTRDAARAMGLAVVDALGALLPAEAVIVATPVNALLPTLAALAPRARSAVLLDVASVRGPVDAFAREQTAGARLVGMHPMAGRTARGLAGADAALLKGRPFLVVPTATTDAPAMALAGEVARAAGGVVTVCSATEHDRIVALVSALPLALAVALAIAGSEEPYDLASFAGPGYRDTTRLALTAPELAEALLLANSGNVVAAIARLRAVLDELERTIAAGDAAAIRALLARAIDSRTALG